jgi:hypothetical protein
VGQLHLSARESSFHVQIKSDQCERESNRFVGFVRVLCGEGVDHVLMNKGGVSVRQRVTTQIVVGGGVCIHGLIRR